MSGFVHLHVHSEYSLLDGACRIGKLAERAAALGQTACAITDHGVMYGVIDFYREAKKAGIKPIIGCEVYCAQRTRFDKTHGLDSEHNHLVLLCENNKGYENLSALVSAGWTEGFYGRPRVDFDLLEQHHEGLIALSACLAGQIPRTLLRGDYEGAKKEALRLQSIFGKENFFLEMQDHGIDEQKQIIPQIIRISEETGIPLVVTNDVHYLEQEDNKMHHVLMCIQTNHTVDDDDGMEFSSEEFYLKSEEEMRALIPSRPDAADNTVRIAERCNVEFEFGNTKLPHFEVPGGQDHAEYFRDQCYAGLYQRYGKNPPQTHIDRLEYELSTITRMGYVDYYLIVNDFIQHAKSQGIPVGPGRGSGAGSIAAYCIGITGIDPMQYELLFERFLNPERVSMPDFDIDFCYERRQEVIDYVVRKYGADHVAQIITFGTMAARGAIRDVGRALGIPYTRVDAIAKLVPMELNITLKKALEVSADLREQYSTDPQVHELLDMAQKLEGMPRHASKHAAGVVITKDPVVSYVPLAKNDESVVTQFTMTTLEELGLLKMDFLGLRTLTVISDAEKMIRRNEPDFSADAISTSDGPVYEMLSAGQTGGVFQFESSGMRNVLMQLGPESLEDLIAVISLYRPGPMESIPRYVQNRHHPEMVTYTHPSLEPILKVTYGCMVYQEQIMQIFRSLAGYTLGRADVVRRAMAKKKKSVMEQERRIFVEGLKDENGNVIVEGCLKRGVDEASAMKIVSEMESFASYAFNKPHAASYAYVSYQTAYLKCHYPKEFMAALLTSVLDNTNKVAEYIAECQRLKIAVLPPSVNESDAGFTVSGKNIRFGLLAAKNLGRNFLNEMMKERQNGRFTSFYNFCSRMYGKDLNRRAVESLIKCGALDGLGSNRRQMLTVLQDILDELETEKRKNIEGQVSLFGGFDEESGGVGQEYEIPSMEEFSPLERLSMEKEIAGMYLSGHPMAEYREISEKLGAARIGDIVQSSSEEGEYLDGDTVTLVAILSSIRSKITKNNSTMAFAVVEDMFGSIEMLVFPRNLEEAGALLHEGNVVVIRGRVSLREDEDAKIVCERVLSLEEAQRRPIARKNDLPPEPPTPRYTRPEPAPEEVTVPVQNPAPAPENTHSAKYGLYLKVPDQSGFAYERSRVLLEIFEGSTPVYYYFAEKKKLMLAPRSLWVDLNEPLLQELKRVLGNDSVVVRD